MIGYLRNGGILILHSSTVYGDVDREAGIEETSLIDHSFLQCYVHSNLCQEPNYLSYPGNNVLEVDFRLWWKEETSQFTITYH